MLPADAVTFLRAVREDRLYAAFLLSMLGLRRGEVVGLRWADVDLTGAQAKARKLPEGTPSISIVNMRVAVAGRIVEGTPKGRGRRKVTHLPIPALVVEALETLQLRQLSEQDDAGAAYGTCPGVRRRARGGR